MIRLIVAIDNENGMAKHGFQPWYIPDDEKYFTAKTKLYGGNVLIGSTTYKTFKGPLSGRNNYVLTRNQDQIKDVELVHDLETFLKHYKNNDLWVVGGAGVFEQVIKLGYADEIYITHIKADFGCDQFFPEISKKYKLINRHQDLNQNGFRYYFATYAALT
ncbi:MAG: dihydrofolate reductase [Candidatus Saccharimonadales bacterium]